MKSINVHLSVHKDVAERLWEINQTLAKEVSKVLSENKADRHIRGGIATKHKYEMIKSANQSN